MGGAHHAYGYRLSHPVAVHFWYDFALFAIGLAQSPEDNPFSARITVPF